MSGSGCNTDMPVLVGSDVGIAEIAGAESPITAAAAADACSAAAAAPFVAEPGALPIALALSPPLSAGPPAALASVCGAVAGALLE
jgi:hypothetical protein